MLSKIKASIPNEPDINWIIVLSDEREILKNECNQLGLKYVSISEADSLSTIHMKTNKGIEVMETGFFQGLDDDTTFNINSYHVFNKYKNTHKIIVGQQLVSDGTIRPAQRPVRCYTDGAQMLIHSDVAKANPIKSLAEDPQADCQFMLDCWNYVKFDEIVLVNEVISNYNALR